MNVAAFNVAAMNIHHIIECSSPDSATFDILFCLFRTWSFDFVHKFCCVTSHDESFGICPFLGINFIRFPRSIMNSLSVPYGMRISFEKVFTMRDNLLQYIPRSFSGFPDRSCSAAPLFHSCEDQD